MIFLIFFKVSSFSFYYDKKGETFEHLNITVWLLISWMMKDVNMLNQVIFIIQQYMLLIFKKSNVNEVLSSSKRGRIVMKIWMKIFMLILMMKNKDLKQKKISHSIHWIISCFGLQFNILIQFCLVSPEINMHILIISSKDDNKGLKWIYHWSDQKVDV